MKTDIVTEIEAQIAALQERLKAEQQRVIDQGKLIEFLKVHPLLIRKDVLQAFEKAQPKRKRGTHAVKSKHTFTMSREARLKMAQHQQKPAKGPLGKAIRAAREKAGLLTSELGAKVGYSSSAVTHWEAGHTKPARKVWPNLAKALGMNEAQLFKHINGAGA